MSRIVHVDVELSVAEVRQLRDQLKHLREDIAVEGIGDVLRWRAALPPRPWGSGGSPAHLTLDEFDKAETARSKRAR